MTFCEVLMNGFLVFVDGFVDMISMAANEFLSWNIAGINLGALLVIGFILWLVVKIIWG